MKRSLILGALAGAVGGLAMKAVVRFVDSRSFGLSASTDAKTAHELWRRMGWETLSERQAERIGAAMHYGFAIGAGAAYAAGANRYPLLGARQGAAFGAILWLIGDEVAITLSGLEDARRTPMISHASALGAHVLYGSVVALILRELSSRTE